MGVMGGACLRLLFAVNRRGGNSRLLSGRRARRVLGHDPAPADRVMRWSGRERSARHQCIRCLAGVVVLGCSHPPLTDDARITGIVESDEWPVPILEVQWAAAITGCVPGGEGCLASGVVVEAAVPVPILAVQCGDAGTPWEELVALALVAPLLVTLGFVTVALAAWPVPMAADQ